MTTPSDPTGIPGVKRAAELTSDPHDDEREILRIQEQSVLPKGTLYLNKGIEAPDGKHIDRLEGYILITRGRYTVHENPDPLSKILLDAADYNVLAVYYS